MKTSTGLTVISLAAMGGALAATSRLATRPREIMNGLPDYETLATALRSVVRAGDPKVNGGLAFNMWAVLVSRDGLVHAVTFSGHHFGDQWPGSRIIAAQKANTANAFSLADFALSTANLYAGTQPGGFLYGIQSSNPMNPAVAYAGTASDFGQANDPMVGKPIGGICVFGGGLALYNERGDIVGGLGVSGDTSCADHNIAWKLRHELGLDYVPAGVNKNSMSPKGDDNIIYDVKNDKSTSGYGHADCGAGEKAIAEGFKTTCPVRMR
jgi:uncharacterized protein GlcG (DUF336 family)